MKYKIVSFAFTLVFTQSIFCLLPLPSKYASKAVHYVKVKQLDAFSCGYNVLFNAANFEHHCGFSNKAYDYSIFQNRVLPYLRSQGYSPNKTSTNEITEHLSHNVLQLQPFFHLHIKKETKGRIVPLLVGKTHIKFPRGTSEKEVQKLLKRAVDERQQKVMNDIVVILGQKRTSVVHFLCYLNSARGVRHGILISLFQNETGRGLYIFDNLNESLSSHSDALKFVDYLCSFFNVTQAHTFVGPMLPSLWPSLNSKF